MIYTARPQRPQRGIFCRESLRPLRSCCEILSSAFASLGGLSLCLVAALPLCALCAFLRLFFLGWHRLSEKNSRLVVLRAPAVFRVVSEDFSRFVNRQQGFV